MTPFDVAFDHVINAEGKYSNNPADSGGETMYGVTIAVARANGYFGEMKDMTLDQAKTIYKKCYWDKLCLDQVGAINIPLAEELFDTAVNMGVSVSGTFLQKTLNVLNNGGTLYPDLVVDGNAGQKTITALQAFLTKRGDNGVKVLMRCLNGLQCARYIQIAESRPKDEAFVYGWVLNRVK